MSRSAAVIKSSRRVHCRIFLAAAALAAGAKAAADDTAVTIYSSARQAGLS